MLHGSPRTGTVEGTGAAINVQLGFVPKKVVLYNIDDAGDLDPILVWNDQMPAASGVLFLSVAGPDAATNKSHTIITTGGVTAYPGTRGGDQAGFTIGANANMNVAGETIVWEAYHPAS
jgi:hypothetical protein